MENTSCFTTSTASLSSGHKVGEGAGSILKNVNGFLPGFHADFATVHEIPLAARRVGLKIQVPSSHSYVHLCPRLPWYTFAFSWGWGEVVGVTS